ncbi:MBL fold metallo-hydrolase [Syntrophobacter fumaroxidans]|uniref:Beta-lactamase domain protein n=1 Tax=Syntrophobacter fumaroxidans (strain DSM 10017 / MPOB) TaxID=335543 RepID=A0LK09_SYNFM|nr:MBL fold metallo-hydrolase [Syntrophobacter fumaroxidans]ABK17761.1 beta-lactamase domain protein [Syntrophobacter fumaroxidans MPOB]
MECRITVLCENTVSAPGLLGEHGFAAFVEIPGDTVLFDTGQGYSLVHNALRLRKNLADASRLVLSHGHYDHTGGILALLGMRDGCDIVAHPDVFSERFWVMETDGREKAVSIGMPWPETYLSTRGARFRLERAFTEIAPNVFITGEVPRRTLFELGSPKFTVRAQKGFAMDPLLDDLSLVLKTSKGLVIVLGCAHAGVVNIMRHAVEKTGVSRIHAILGGTHLGLSPAPQFDPTIEAIKSADIGLLAVSHCTGQQPVARLASEFGERFAFGNVGFVIEV